MHIMMESRVAQRDLPRITSTFQLIVGTTKVNIIISIVGGNWE